MYYVETFVYDNGTTDVHEVSIEYLKENGLELGTVVIESETYDQYIDSFETQQDMVDYINQNK